jgi:hypothetical protein
VFRFKLFAVVVCTCAALSIVPAYAQTDDDEFRSQFVYGINFNTNGGIIGGAMVRYVQALSPRMYQSFGVEIVNVKHPKELRSQSYATGNTYILGKSNYLFVIRPTYGRELVLFRKAPDEGVQINAIGAIGPSLGLIKPYYIQYAYSPTNAPFEQYNPQRHSPSAILGSGPLFEGMGEIDLSLGLNARVGLNFELSGFRNSVTGFEVGFVAEAFPRQVVIIPEADNRSFFTSLYLTLFFGTKR